MTLSGETVFGCNGLARDPTDGTCYIILKTSQGRPSTRLLATIDESTGVATLVGNPGDLQISSLAFDSSGTLYATVGDQAGIEPPGDRVEPETLQTLSKADATPTLFQTLGNGSDGEAIAFNPDDGLMYHFSGNLFLNDPVNGKIFETINLNDNTVTNIPLSSVDSDEDFETSAFVYNSGNTFLYADIAILSTFWSVNTSGVESFIGDMDHTSKGLAFDCGVEPDPEPPSGPLVIIPTMNQWGMIFASIILGIFAVIALRRRTES